MEITGEQTFNAERSLVWRLLLDPDAIREAIPGCEAMTRREDEREIYDITIRVGIAGVKGTYTGTVEVAEAAPEESYRLIASGAAKPGSVSGDAVMQLADGSGGTTIVRYTGNIQARGAIARLGNRLVGGAARLMIGQFFKGMEKQVEARKSG